MIEHLFYLVYDNCLQLSRLSPPLLTADSGTNSFMAAAAQILPSLLRAVIFKQRHLSWSALWALTLAGNPFQQMSIRADERVRFFLFFPLCPCPSCWIPRKLNKRQTDGFDRLRNEPKKFLGKKHLSSRTEFCLFGQAKKSPQIVLGSCSTFLLSKSK